MSANEGLWAPGEASGRPDEPKSQSSALDNLLLVLAGLFFAGSCLLLVGIIPVLIMAVGALLAIKSGDVKQAKVAARFIQIILIVGALVCGVISANKQVEVDKAAATMQGSAEAYAKSPDADMTLPQLFDKYGDGAYRIMNQNIESSNAESSNRLRYAAALSDRNDYLIAIGLIGLVAIIIEFLWIQPFARQLPVWRAAGVQKQSRKANTKTGKIIKRDALAPYSVADELIKWNKLRDEGHVTEAQFEEARAKLLGGF